MTYKEKILAYCEDNSITVPPGFGRNSASHLAIIRLDVTPHKLIALTWFKVTDLIYYLKNTLGPELGEELDTSIRILDFKSNKELVWNGSSKFIPKD